MNETGSAPSSRMGNPAGNGNAPADVIFTVATKRYLARTRVLMASVAEHEPDARRVCVLADRADGCFDPTREDFEVLEAESLGIPAFRNMCFRYTPLELCCALKPMAARALFASLGCTRIIYMDSDMRIYRPLREAHALLEDHAIVLTPHVVTPAGAVAAHNPRYVFATLGMYNAGFFGLAKTNTAWQFVEWWSLPLATRCHYYPHHGLCHDQRWLDMVPALFKGAAILCDPGYNVAYWNRSERPIQGQPDTGYLSAGTPLTLFHFSGLIDFSQPDAPLMGACAEAHRKERHVLCAIAEGYRTEVLAAGEAEARRWPYSYDCFENGLPIHPCIRRRFSWIMDPRGNWPADPFSTLARPSVFDSRPPARDRHRSAHRRGGRLFLAILGGIRFLLRVNGTRAPSRLVLQLYRWLAASASAVYAGR